MKNGYRGYSSEFKKYIYGSYVESGTHTFIVEYSNRTYEVVPDSVGQSVGRDDKYWIPIYEGNLVRIAEIEGAVQYDDNECAFVVRPFSKNCITRRLGEFASEHIEVVGDMYEVMI